MLLKECYDAFGGDYESVIQRISKDEIIRKFLIKFLSEPSFGNLSQALENKDYKQAFCEAHSLKGLSANLSFQRLEKSAGALTELLRDSEGKEIDNEECTNLFACVSEDYKAVVDSIRKLEAS